MNLTEKWALTLPKSVMTDRPAEIFTNPTPREFSRLVKDWGENCCRACISQTGDLYVWRLDDAFHDEVQRDSGIAMAPVSLLLHWPKKVVWWCELMYWHEEGQGHPYDPGTKTEGMKILNSHGLAKLYGSDWALVGEDDDGNFTIDITPQWLSELTDQDDLVEGDVVSFPQPNIPDTLKSFTDFMSDPRPLHMMYQVGDVLTYKGEAGRVRKCNDNAVVLDLPSGLQVVKRNDPDLEVTDYRVARNIPESIDYTTMAGEETARLVTDTDPTLFKRASRIRYLDSGEVTRESHVVARDGDKIVGMGGMQVNPHDKEQLWIKFVSVDPAYQGKGIGRALLKHMYEFAQQHGYKMAPGGFTEQGERLRHLHDEFDVEYPEVAYDRDQRGNYINNKGKIVRNSD